MILEISRFESLHPALKSGVARECIHLASGRLKDITSMHIGALVKLAGQQSGRKSICHMELLRKIIWRGDTLRRKV